MCAVLQKRLLDIAIKAFGRHGLDGASTRSIATAAGTAMSSITYHYGGKRGLYLAAADYIAQRMAETMLPVSSVDIAAGDADAARRAIHDILGALLTRMLDAKNEHWALFIIREQMHPTEAFTRLFEGPMGMMLRSLANLVSIAAGRSEDEAARITAMTLFGQVLVVRSAHASLLAVLDRRSIDAELAVGIRQRVLANTDAVLDRLAAERLDDR